MVLERSGASRKNLKTPWVSMVLLSVFESPAGSSNSLKHPAASEDV